MATLEHVGMQYPNLESACRDLIKTFHQQAEFVADLGHRQTAVTMCECLQRGLAVYRGGHTFEPKRKQIRKFLGV